MTAIALTIYWIIYVGIVFFATRNIKKTVIVWMPMQFLFNDMVALKFSPPVLTLSIAVNFTLPFIFYYKYQQTKNNRIFNKDSFFLKPVYIAFLASYIISLVFTIAPLGSIVNSTMKMLVRSLLMSYIFFKCINTLEDVKLFLKSSVIIGIMWGSLGIVEFVMHDNPIQDFIFFASPDPFSEFYKDRVYYTPPFIRNGLQMRMGLVRAYSFFNIHLAFGRTCLAYAFILLVFYLQRQKFVNKKLLLAAIIITASGIFTCNSKTPILGMAMMVLAFLDFTKAKNMGMFFGTISLIIVVFYFFPQYWESIMSLFDENLAEEAGGSSVEGRKQQLAAAMRLFRQNPLFGNGVGALATLKKSGDAEDILGAEGWYLSIPPERGLFGCAVFLYQYVYIFMRTKHVIPSKYILFLLLGTFVTETVSGLLDSVVLFTIVIVLYRYFLIIKRERNCNIASL